MQCDSTLKQNLSDATVRNFMFYLHCGQMPKDHSICMPNMRDVWHALGARANCFRSYRTPGRSRWTEKRSESVRKNCTDTMETNTCKPAERTSLRRKPLWQNTILCLTGSSDIKRSPFYLPILGSSDHAFSR